MQGAMFTPSWGTPPKRFIFRFGCKAGFYLMLGEGDSEFLLGVASEATGRGDAYNDEAAGVSHQVGFGSNFPKIFTFPLFQD